MTVILKNITKTPKKHYSTYRQIRNEQIKEITEEQVLAEEFSSRAEFISAFLKMCTNCAESDWVWVIEFERISKEEATK